MRSCPRSICEPPASACAGREVAETVACAAGTCSGVALRWFTGHAGGSGTWSRLHAQNGPQLHPAEARPRGIEEQQFRWTLSRGRQHALLLIVPSWDPQHALPTEREFPARVRSPCSCETLARLHPHTGGSGVGSVSISAAKDAAMIEIRRCKSPATTF